MNKLIFRRIFAVASLAIVAIALILQHPENYISTPKTPNTPNQILTNSKILLSYQNALKLLEKLPVKGRAPKTGYSRDQFYKAWPIIDGCNLRQRIIKRELGETAVLGKDHCTVDSGSFTDPYTGKSKTFKNRAEIAKELQIDHVVSLSDAWQKGAQNLTKEQRYDFATDPLNLIAADSTANLQKSDSDAASWLPKNHAFRCEYLSRQISVKHKYSLWITPAEKSTMLSHLSPCANPQ